MHIQFSLLFCPVLKFFPIQIVHIIVSSAILTIFAFSLTSFRTSANCYGILSFHLIVHPGTTRSVIGGGGVDKSSLNFTGYLSAVDWILRWSQFCLSHSGNLFSLVGDLVGSSCIFSHLTPYRYRNHPALSFPQAVLPPWGSIPIFDGFFRKYLACLLNNSLCVSFFRPAIFTVCSHPLTIN